MEYRYFETSPDAQCKFANEMIEIAINTMVTEGKLDKEDADDFLDSHMVTSISKNSLITRIQKYFGLLPEEKKNTVCYVYVPVGSQLQVAPPAHEDKEVKS